MHSRVTIVVAAHKRSPMPSNRLYMPLHVGSALARDEWGNPVDFGYARDESGNGISELNPWLGTQTGLYWAWANLDADYKGLVHYRRYFVGGHKVRGDMLASAITYDEIVPLLMGRKVFAPRKRWYGIETLGSHYAHTHDGSHLTVVRSYIASTTPEVLPAFDEAMSQRWGYMFNMMVLRSDMMDRYCSWLFPILFHACETIDSSGMSDFDRRFCGRLSELLFNVWVRRVRETGLVSEGELYELPYVEDVDWLFKVRSFLGAKVMHKSYGRSS